VVTSFWPIVLLDGRLCGTDPELVQTIHFSALQLSGSERMFCATERYMRHTGYIVCLTATKYPDLSDKLEILRNWSSLLA
jgi:hypothetical protein